MHKYSKLNYINRVKLYEGDIEQEKAHSSYISVNPPCAEFCVLPQRKKPHSDFSSLKRMIHRSGKTDI
jgi:hypothetical protein